MEATIDSAIIESFTSVLTPSRRSAANEALQRIRSLVHDDSNDSAAQFDSLSSFLQEFASAAADLFAATAVAVWFRADDASSIQRKMAIGWENYLLDEQTSRAHLRMIEFAMQQTNASAYQPFSISMTTASESTSKSSTLSISNPTDSYVLLVPVQFNQKPIGVLELVLGPKPLREPHQQLMAAYLAWLSWLSGIVERGLVQFFDTAGSPIWSALDVLQQTSARVEALQKQIRSHIEQSLQQLAGQNFGSLEANQSVAKQVHALLDSKGLRVRCSECGTAAILRCQKAGNSKTGSFMFDHYLETGRTFHGGGTTFPKLVVVDKPPRRQAK